MPPRPLLVLGVFAVLGVVLLFLLASWRFVRALRVVRIDREPLSNGRIALDEALVLALVAFNPIVAYQAWSAHPDAPFAALVLAPNLVRIERVRPRAEVDRLPAR